MKKLLSIIIGLILILPLTKGQVIYPYLKTIKQHVFRVGIERLFFSTDSIFIYISPPKEIPEEITDTLGFTVADYYVSSSGDDTNDGVTPNTAWKTLTRVQTAITAGTFIAGDTIAFRRDDKFTGTLAFTNTDGTTENPIVFGTYENGQRPIITTQDTLTSWTYHKTHIYYAAVAGDPTMARFLYINGIRYNKGKTEWGVISNDLSSTTFVDTSLNAPPGYWEGATVVTHAGYEWELVRSEIAYSNEDTIILAVAPSYGLDSLQGYFFVDDTTCLNEHGEWCYDENTHRVYIYLENAPETYTISCDVNSTYIDIANSDYVIFDGLYLKGGYRGIYLRTSDNCIIKNCVLDHFYEACRMEYSNEGLFFSNRINLSTSKGLVMARMYRSFVTKNYIAHTGDEYVYAEDRAYGDGLKAIDVTYNWDEGLNDEIGSDSVVVDKNEIYKSGYSGIHVSQGNKIYIKENKLQYCSNLKQDGGAIYLWNCDTLVTHGGHGNGYDSCYVYRNYVKFDIDSGQALIGEIEGRLWWALPDTIYADYALYCDDYCQRIGIYENYFDGSRAGVFLHNDYDMKIYNNRLLGRSNTKCNLLYSDAGGSGGFNQDRLLTKGNIITSYHENGLVPANSPTWVLLYRHGANPPTYDESSGNYFMLLNSQYSAYTSNEAIQEYSDANGTDTYTVDQWNSHTISDGTDKAAPFLYPTTGLMDVDSMAIMFYNFSDTVNPLNIGNYFGDQYFYYDQERVDYTDSIMDIQPYTGVLLLRSYNEQLPPDIVAPDTVKYFTLSSPARDSIQLSLLGFATDADTVRIMYNLGFTYPTSRTDGALYAAFGASDTTTYHSRKTYIDANTDTTYSFTVWSGDASGNWTVTPNKDQVAVDSVGVPIIVYFEEYFDDSTNYIYDEANWHFVYEPGDSAAEFKDISPAMIRRICSLPGNTPLKYTFTISNANTTARVAFTDNSENFIVEYADYGNGAHIVTGTTDSDGSTSVAIYGSTSSPARWRITYLKVETNN